MCKLNIKSGTTRIDQCLIEKINQINQERYFKTLSSCCGHGKYPQTIVVMNKETNFVVDINTGIYLGKGKRKGNKYYKRDKEGYYFIPEVISI